ncbi:MAG: hypothetical protein KDI82_01765 [Gammaproteobacteria bacterium]|nr:hypothetical protein [Gammaproteobacteria bacterium]
MSDSTDQPMIRFGGELIPAHDAWKKMETVTVVVDHIDRFNEHFPHLSSRNTRDVVPLVRRRLKEIELHIPRPVELPDIGPEAAALLASAAPEDVLDMLAEKHGAQITLVQLVQLAGEAAYLGALVREGKEFENNRILPEQTAQLWNELGRPVPGGGLWSAKKVEMVLSGKIG